MQLLEYVYNGRNNVIDLDLTSRGTSITIDEYSAITRVQVLVGSTLIDSNVHPEFFDLSATDHITLKFGVANLSAGRYAATLIVFDAAHTLGLVWGAMVIEVLSL